VLAALGLAVTKGGERLSEQRESRDLAAIEGAIENSISLIGEACLESNHGQEQYYKDQLSAYWSDVPPTGDEREARWDRYRAQSSTPDPTEKAERVRDAATLVASDRIPQELATLIAERVRPTPNWDPDASPLEDVKANIDECQAKFGLGPGIQSIDYGVESVDFKSIDFLGDTAAVTAEVSLWTEYERPEGGTERVADVGIWQFEMARERVGWRIRSVSFDSEQ
jgi:hypothetical protein